MQFNKLTPAEAERLALLLEELGEAQQAIGKILRHGYESFDPYLPPPMGETNRGNLCREVGDVVMAIGMLLDANDLDEQAVSRRIRDKTVRVKEYLHHQG